MIEQERVGERATDGYVPFYAMGESAKGAFKCSECGYGVAISAALPRCPMCGGETWEESPWAPLARAGDGL